MTRPAQCLQSWVPARGGTVAAFAALVPSRLFTALIPGEGAPACR
jgi:hypothetical protein